MCGIFFIGWSMGYVWLGNAFGGLMVGLVVFVFANALYLVWSYLKS